MRNSILRFGTKILGITAFLLAGGSLEQAFSQDDFSWQSRMAGSWVASIAFREAMTGLGGNLRLLKLEPREFSFSMLELDPESQSRDGLKKRLNNEKAVAAINTNFFDKKGNALGWIVKQGKELHRRHRQGSVMTGIFAINHLNQVLITHRDWSEDSPPQLAFQAGPRLIVNGKRTQLKNQLTPARRSGIAITKDGELILYATETFFPGASLKTIQEVLSHPKLGIAQALNLDGGGSSKLFVSRSLNPNDKDLFITGGDAIPVMLIVKRK